ncbi:MAG: hypothetical protein HFG73_02225 [Hungatella sp.]|nr:hypothetical protein [Hungatella sp.]
MKKNTLKIFCLTLLLMVLGTGTVYANESFPHKCEDGENETELVQPRSRYLGSAISEITNKGNGVLHIYADFTSFNAVPWAQITINLERTKSDSGSWSKVKTYTYTFRQEDEPDGILSYGSADFDVSGFATNYYYRLTCEHKVKTPSGSYETKTTRTDGVLLTPYPDFRSLAKPN